MAGNPSLAGKAVRARRLEMDPDPEQPGLIWHGSVFVQAEVESYGRELSVDVAEVGLPIFRHG